MKTLRIAEAQHELVKNGILITGAPRSGTTIAGKIIGSFAGLEYHFEPPSLYMISSLYAAGEISLETASNLLTVYLCEDLYLESILGRRANLRPTDDSLILNRLSWSELMSRWNDLKTRSDVLDKIADGSLRLAVKMPNVLDSIDLFRHAMPEMQVVLVVRDGCDVVPSIVKKQWLTDNGLRRELWPYAPSDSTVPIPYWVPCRIRDRWPSMTPETRACMMWALHAAKARQLLSSGSLAGTMLHVLRYEDLVAHTESTVSRVAAALGHDITDITTRRIKEIRAPGIRSEKKRSGVFQRVDPDVMEDFLQVNRDLGYKSPVAES